MQIAIIKIKSPVLYNSGLNNFIEINQKGNKVDIINTFFNVIGMFLKSIKIKLLC